MKPFFERKGRLASPVLDRMNYDFSPIQKELTELYACGFPSPYTIQETAAVFQLYLELFEASTGGVHPPIGKTQVRRIAAKMPYFEGSTISENRPADILPEEYPLLIAQHFKTQYHPGCDYRAFHFFSGRVRWLRWCEVCF